MEVTCLSLFLFFVKVETVHCHGTYIYVPETTMLVAKDVLLRPKSILFVCICQSPATDVVVVARLRGVFFFSSLMAACSLGSCSLRNSAHLCFPPFLSNDRTQRCGCFQMQHKLVRAVRLMVFLTTGNRRESGFVWLKARATGMTVEIGWERKLVTGRGHLVEKMTTLLAELLCERWPGCSNLPTLVGTNMQ